MKIAIVGGGTAGWMTAAALSHIFQDTELQITLVESEEISSVGVGEATIPHIRYFNQRLGIDEQSFIRDTSATYKLGIEFVDWGGIGESYIHPFGEFGKDISQVKFLDCWLRAVASGNNTDLFDYSLPVEMCRQNKFAYPSRDPDSIAASYSYAFHIDASAYSRYLRTYCEKRNVRRVEGKVIQVNQSEVNGCIESLQLASNEESYVEADFFVDCTGFRSLLLGKALGVEFEDWSKWLPCDRAIAVPSAPPAELQGELRPYTIAKAHQSGWKWTIPLQHREGNGVVYSSAFMDSETAENILSSELGGDKIGEYNYLKFTAGRRVKTWSKNCVAIGLSSGFLEPLESTSIYLIQAAIMKLVELFPSRGEITMLRDEFNRSMNLEYDRIKDFLILHYCLTKRDDSEFWNYCRTMSLPLSVESKIESFKRIGFVDQYEKGLFLLPSWIAVMIGQGLVPENYHVLARSIGEESIKRNLIQYRNCVREIANACSSHESQLRSHLLASRHEAQWPSAAMSLYSVFS